MRAWRRLHRAAGVAGVCLVCAPAPADEVSLEALGQELVLDAGRITLSGVSSGAYMAQQMHVIHSRHVAGAGLLAGGPYRCAAGSYPPWSWMDVTGLYAATSRCSDTNPFWFFGGAPDLGFSLQETRREARRGGIDDPDGMAGDRVWLFSGGEDDTVPRPVVDTLAAYYRRFVAEADLRYETLAAAGHAMITEAGGTPCGVSAPPFISDCDYDAAGRLLAHLLGALRARAPEPDPDALHTFPQAPFFDVDDRGAGLNATGYVYVPGPCMEGAACALHVVFHGCQQSAARLGDRFVTGAGYNEWAESNAIVMLYPQARAWTGTPFGARTNPRGCWDWWGYSGAGYHRRDGTQPAAVAAMINALLGHALLDTGR